MVPSLDPFLILVLAVAASLALIPLVRRAAPRFRLLDLPDPRKVHSVPVPRVGGWGITLGIVLPLLVALRFDAATQSFVIGALVLFAFGVWDDARPLGHWTKFVGQIAAVSVVVWYGDVWVARLPFDWSLTPLAGKLFTTFALVGAINAVNHSDGLDGLAGGESLLSLIAIAVLGYMASNAVVVTIALATIGGILGFLRYNTHPARVFMGDAGSQVLGFTLGFLVVYLTQVAHPALGAALPLLLLGLPIADILSVLYQRIRGGSNWFRATRNHLHHRLLALGFDHHEAVVLIYTAQAGLVVSAVVLRYEADAVVAAAYAIAVGGLFAALISAERGRFTRRGSAAFPASAATLLARLHASEPLRHLPLAVVSVVVPAFMLLTSLWAKQIPGDFAIVAGVLAAVLAAETFRAGAGSLAARAAVYAAAAFCAYLFVNHPGGSGLPVELAAVFLLGVLAAAIAVHARFASTPQEFGTTPTDYLIALGVIALAVFAAIDAEARGAVELVAFGTVLLYGCEVVICSARRARALQIATLAVLAIMAVRGIAAI